MDPATEEKGVPFAKKIASLTLPEKIRIALTGNKDVRTVLYRDANKKIGEYILQNPGIMDDEILFFARDRNASEDMLVAISRRKDWVKKYPLRLALTLNPKTPIPLALNILKTLREADLRKIVRSKDVSMYVSSGARRILASKGLL